MGKETEKMFKELNEFMADKPCETEEDMNNLVNEFMAQYNPSVHGELTEQNAETSDDFLELAESAPTKKKALQYAKKAFELDPDNLDAEKMIVELSATTHEKMLQNYKKLIDKATKRLEEQGYFSEDCIGDFWLIVETRPYMRLHDDYLELLIKSSRIHLAVDECEEMLRLCKNDNLGIRYRLMHLYAYLEDEQSALKLLEKYPDDESTQFLLPMSILYYKLGNLTEATKYLKKLKEVNNDTYKFFKCLYNHDLDDYLDNISPYGYRPFTIEEFIEELRTNIFLLSQSIAYFDWAYRKLKTMKK
ncbi:MAG: tetratricopeptide repeat protein [Acutalibacteraceae bacterium]